jgi:hypothetical protein
MKKPKHPSKSQPAHWGLYRAGASCRIGRDALDDRIKVPFGVSKIEYALYNLLHAVEELAKERMEWHEKNGEAKQ